MGSMDDFYEPDEPLDEVLRAFNEGEPGITTRPSRGQNVMIQAERFVDVPRVEAPAVARIESLHLVPA